MKYQEILSKRNIINNIYKTFVILSYSINQTLTEAGLSLSASCFVWTDKKEKNMKRYRKRNRGE